MPLDGLYNIIRAVQDFDIASESIDIIKLNSGTILSMLKSQLESGIRGDNKSITIDGRLYYRSYTESIKTNYGVGIGSYIDRITLYMYGDFYNSLRLVVSGYEFFITSDISYFDDIMKKVGNKSVLDLTSENLSWFSENVLKPELQKRFDDAIRRNNNR